MKLRRIFLLAALLAGPAASAQFFQAGDDPFGRWSEQHSAHYRILYPEGLDSLATAYIKDLERWRPSVGLSAGSVPGSRQWGKTPIILHADYPYSNGSVVWAPKRMDLYTRPEPYGTLPQPWMTQLTVHESRHLSQMQLAYRPPLRWVNFLVGEIWPGVIASLFTPQPLLEGDAVVAETALTASGRGRSGDFLAYYPVTMDNGERRDPYQWVYGSFKHAGADYYTVGYMTVAGMRYFYDMPDFTAGYLDRVCRRPIPVASFQRYVKSISGKSFRKTWQDIQEGFYDIWTREAGARAPFMPMEQVSRKPAYATDYAEGAWVDGSYYALKRGKTTGTRLVRLSPDGSEQDCGAFSSSASAFYPGKERTYWSETIPDPRWTLGGKSIIRYFEKSAKKRTDLTSEGRLYNPQPGPGGLLAVVEYPVHGGSNLLLVGEKDGRIRRRIPAPDGVQLTESAWIGEDLFCLGVEEGGFGIWQLRSGAWGRVLAPGIQSMENLDGGDGFLEFVSDRSGVKELYRFDPETGRAWQLSNTPYGATDFSRSEDGELWFSALTPEGKAIFRSPGMDPVEVDIRSVHRYPVAEKLSEQERLLTAAAAPADTAVSAPRRYHKPLHLLKFHSWAPIWFNYDAVESLSMDLSYDTASPGLVGLFQNDLGTAWGTLGYSAQPSSDGPWLHSGHAQFTYSGLYPVLEANFHFYSRGGHQYLYQERKRETGPKTCAILSRSISDEPFWNGGLKAYIPFRYNRSGILSGWVPQVSWAISGNRFQNGVLEMEMIDDFMSGTEHAAFLDYKAGKNVLMQSLRASVRGYRTLPAADSQVYPRWGVGAEAGASFRPGLAHIYAPVSYAYLYGYLPGFTRTQGLRLTALGQWQLPNGAPFGENSVSVWPRGFTATEGQQVARQSARQLCVTADYAIPLYLGDISWFSPVAYISHFLVIPHVDWMSFGGGRNGKGTPVSSSLFSAGADLTVELENFLWIPFPSSVGISASWQGGPFYSTLLDKDPDRKPYAIELIFSIDL